MMSKRPRFGVIPGSGILENGTRCMAEHPTSGSRAAMHAGESVGVKIASSEETRISFSALY